MQINLQNIEDVIFQDKQVQSLLSEYHYFFDQWHLGKRVPGLKTMGRQAVLDLLNALTAKDIEVLEQHFGDTITLDKIDCRLVKNHQASIDELEAGLCQFAGFQDFCLSRTDQQAYLCFWK